MKSFALTLALLLAAPLASGEIIDRVSATVDTEVITLSELNQVVAIRLIEPRAGEDEAAYRRRVLDAMIVQMLRFRDVERFGAQEDVSKDQIEARFRELVERAGGQEPFTRVLQNLEMTEDEVRTLIKRDLQVTAYIDERFSPLIFISLDEIERYYRETYSAQRRARSLPVPPLGEVREEIRDLLRAERLQTEITRWSEQLRARANVDILYR